MFSGWVSVTLLMTLKGVWSLSQCNNEYPHTQEGYWRALQRVLTIKNENDFIQSSTLQNMRLCPKTLQRPRIYEETFEFQPVKERKILVFSAFHEMRKNAGGPAVRIIATGLQRAYRDVGDLYCTLWYEGRPQGVSVGPAVYDLIYPSIVHHDMWCSHFILCDLPANVSGVPYAVSVTEAPCSPADNALYVNHYDVIQQGQYAVCYPTVYGHFRDWKLLVEMFELQRLLGAEHITIYLMSASPETSMTLKYFQQQGWLTVIPWPFPNLLANVFFQRATLNDCLYRNMHHYNYIAVHDLDEVLVPRVGPAWADLILPIDKPTYAAFLFQHYYFRRNSTEINSSSSLISQSSLYRTDVVTPPGKIRCKAMYKTAMVRKLDLHFAYEMVPGGKEYLVDPEDGALHHYRATPMEAFAKHPEYYHFVEDRYTQRYGAKLNRAYKEHLNELKLLLDIKEND